MCILEKSLSSVIFLRALDISWITSLLLVLSAMSILGPLAGVKGIELTSLDSS